MKETKEQELDLTTLNEIFDINYNNLPDRKNPNDEKSLDFDEEIDYDEPITILQANIKKANRILDAIQTEIDRGNFTARMVEVAGGIINSITAASKEIITDKNYNKYLDIREELAKLKEREVEIKERKGLRGGGGVTNQNLIVTSREDLLRVLGNKEPIKIGETKKVKQLPEKTNQERN